MNTEIKRNTKAPRIAKSKIARLRRKTSKNIVADRTERLYSRLRKMRKTKND